MNDVVRDTLAGTFECRELADFVACGTTHHSLISETIPAVHAGLTIRSFSIVDDQKGLVFTLDCVPKVERFLDLVSGRFAVSGVCIKSPNALFDCTNADASLADLLLRPTSGIHRCISDIIRYDEPEKHYREYQKANGKWLLISDAGAKGVVADRIAALLKPTLHLQRFREVSISIDTP